MHGFIFQDDRILLTKVDNDYRLPSLDQLAGLKNVFIRQHELRMLDFTPFLAADIPTDIPLTTQLESLPLRKAFDILESPLARLAMKSFAIITWDRNHQYCSRCSTQLTYKPGVFERTCPTCHLAVYPRISPSIIVLIRKNDHLLMARSPHFPPGAYGLIAGFVEVGESLEETVHREVKEEVGIQIKNLQYFGSQPWPFPDSLMIAFTADYASGELIIDKREIEAADWYRYDNLPGRPSTKFSISSALIDSFVNEQMAK